MTQFDLRLEPHRFSACTNGQFDVVKRLLEPGNEHVLVNQNNKDTVLHAAVSSQNVDVLRLMLEVGLQTLCAETGA